MTREIERSTGCRINGRGKTREKRMMKGRNGWSLPE
jgi:hypothetical protein